MAALIWLKVTHSTFRNLKGNGDHLGMQGEAKSHPLKLQRMENIILCSMEMK